MTGYDSYRGGSGTPLVLLHGVQASWRIWRPVLPYLEPFHEVYAPTLPGHRGGRPIESDRAGITGLADALETQLDEAGLGEIHLAGNSLGAAITLELARRGRARSVVAIAPPGAWRTTKEMERVVRLVRTGRRLGLRPTTRRLLDRPALRPHLLRVGFEHGERIPALELDDMVQDLAECTGFDDVLRCIRRDGATASFQPSCPIRIAWPQHDRMLPYLRYGSGFAELIPDAEIVMLPGVGHVPMYDDPALVGRSILHVTTNSATDKSITPGTQASGAHQQISNENHSGAAL